MLGVAAFIRGTTTVDFSSDFPILNVALSGAVTRRDALPTGSVFQSSYNKSEVQQIQASGRWEFQNNSGLDFGIGATEVNNRTAAAVMQQNDWGGLGAVDDYSDDIWTPTTWAAIST